MRSLILILTLAVSAVAAAEDFRYIIPIAGYIATDDGTYYYANTVIQNLSSRPATILPTDIYPLNTAATCSGGEAFTIPARGRITVGPMSCLSAASSISLLSSEKLSIRTELDSHKTMVSGWDKQIIEAPTEWIPAGAIALSEAIIRSDGPRQANLIVINPSETTLTLAIEMERPEIGRTTSFAVEVPAHATRFLPLAEVTDPAPPPFMYSYDGRHLVRITGSGPWQGGVSSVFKGPSMYVPAVAFEPETVTRMAPGAMSAPRRTRDDKRRHSC